MVKLAGEMDAIKKMVDMAVSNSNGQNNVFSGESARVTPKLQRIYQDAMASGNLHTQRAACEVFSGLLNQMPRHVEDKSDVNGLARGAARDLENLRFTDEMVNALDERNKVTAEIAELRKEIFDASIALDEGDANNIFYSGIFRGILNQYKPLEDGSMRILADDAPEVTGFTFIEAKADAVVGGNE